MSRDRQHQMSDLYHAALGRAPRSEARSWMKRAMEMLRCGRKWSRCFGMSPTRRGFSGHRRRSWPATPRPPG